VSRRTGGETVFLGGDGQDAASGESNGVTTLNGEADADRFGVKHAAGTLTLLGGDGDDTFEMDDLDSAGSARTEVRAGPGNDTIEPRLGAGSDLIDCGPGSDSVELPEGNLRRLLLGHTYIDCPIVAAQFKNPRLSPRGASVAITLLPPARAKAKVAVKQVSVRGKTVFRSPAVRVRFVRGRSSRVTLKVPKKLLRLRRARLYVIVDATSASGDRTRLEENVLFKR
jgi:Ca2+-binding RTX toxin-like protein